MWALTQTDTRERDSHFLSLLLVISVCNKFQRKIYIDSISLFLSSFHSYYTYISFYKKFPLIHPNDFATRVFLTLFHVFFVCSSCDMDGGLVTEGKTNVRHVQARFSRICGCYRIKKRSIKENRPAMPCLLFMKSSSFSVYCFL